MNRNTLVLAAVAVLSAASLAHAAPSPAVQTWLGDARQQLDRKLDDAGVRTGGQAVDVQVTVDGTGELLGARVVRSSGSLDLDNAVAHAVRRVYAAAPPAELTGRKVVFHLGSAGGVASGGL